MIISVLSALPNVLAAKLNSNNNKNYNLPRLNYPAPLNHILLDNVSSYDYHLLPLNRFPNDVVKLLKKHLLLQNQRKLNQMDIVTPLDRMRASLFGMVVVEGNLEPRK